MPRGRPPKPSALKAAQGNPGKRKPRADEPKPACELPAAPAWLCAAARLEWDRLGPILVAIGLLTRADRAAFAGYCQSYGRWEEIERCLRSDDLVVEVGDNGARQQIPEVSIARNYHAQWVRMLSEFGLTPAARARALAIAKTEDPDDDPANLIR